MLSVTEPANAYIDFVLAPIQHGKTHVWDVMTNGGDRLGQIRWFGRWRQYAFFPCEGTLYSRVCLTDVADFIGQQAPTRRTKEGNDDG